MEQNEANMAPAAQKRESGGCPCGCGGRKGSYKIVIVIWMTLLLGGISLHLHFQQKRNAEAERLLNEAYALYGQQEFAASTERLRQSAELGNVWAQLYYGERLKTGFAAEQNPAEAVKWLRKAAKQKSPEAFFQLGLCYENGEGVERDLDKSEKWYRKASVDPAFASSAQNALDRIANLKAAETPPAAY